MRKTLITLGLLCGLAFTSTGHAIGAESGSTITNTATFNYRESTTGPDVQTVSPPVQLQVNQVAAIAIFADGTTDEPGQTSSIQPGETGTLTYTFVNNGNGNDQISFTVEGNIPPTSVSFTDASGTVDLTPTEGTYLTPSMQPDAKATVTISYNTTAPTSTTTAGSTSFIAGTPAGLYTLGNPNGTSAAWLANNNIGTLPGTYTYPNGSDSATYSVTDRDNVGEVIIERLINLASDQQALTEPLTFGKNITFSHTITNVGNTPLTAEEITVNQGDAIPGYTITYTASYPGGTGNSSINLEEAINQAMATTTLTPGQTINITNIYVPTLSTVTGGSTSFDPYSPVTTTIEVQNNALTGDIVFSDTITTSAQPQGVATKTQASCTSTCPPVNEITSNTNLNINPGGSVAYRINALNPGTLQMFKPTVSDQIPQNLIINTIGARINLTCSSRNLPTTALLFSTDGSTWVNSGNLNLASGDKVMVGYDSSQDGKITVDDILPPGASIDLVVNGTVRAVNNTTNNDPVSNSATIDNSVAPYSPPTNCGVVGN